jgi:WXG100 family type VII secretion target
MPKINITPETLRERAKTLRGEKSEHENVYQKMKSLVNDVISAWEGESQQAFQASFQQKDTFFRQFSEEVEAFAVLMDTAANRMEATEAELKSQMNR